jgi:hypothetical protein
MKIPFDDLSEVLEVKGIYNWLSPEIDIRCLTQEKPFVVKLAFAK